MKVPRHREASIVKKKRRRKGAGIVPRLGPATNLRPAGAHESLKRYNRKRLKAQLRREPEMESEG
jgi:hypothetical protein